MQWLYMTFYLYIGVLGAAAPNKPTAEPVGKRCTFSALAIIKQTPSVNIIQAMRLLPVCKQNIDILAYSRIGVFSQTMKKSIESFAHLCNRNRFDHNEISLICKMEKTVFLRK